MEFKLKSISKAGIPEAISKVELYRSLNEPEEAESICRDILAVEPENQLALRLLGLAITDQFCGDASDRSREVENLFERLRTLSLHSLGRRCAASPRRKRFVPRATMTLSFAGTVAPACCKAIPASWKRESRKHSMPLTAPQSEWTWWWGPNPGEAANFRRLLLFCGPGCPMLRAKIGKLNPRVIALQLCKSQ